MRILIHTQIQNSEPRRDRFPTLTPAPRSSGAIACWIATGRQINTANLGLELAGVAVDSSGAVVIDEHMRTSVSHLCRRGAPTSRNK